MADRYQNRPFPSDDRGRGGGDQRRSGQVESDPLAELARLIGQSDTFAPPVRSSAPVSPSAPPVRPSARSLAAAWESPDYHEPQVEGIEGYSESHQDPAPGWIRRANVQAQPAPHLQPENAEHRWHGQGVEQGAESIEAELRAYQALGEQSDHSHYDDGQYDQIEAGDQDVHDDPDNPYAYQDDYSEHDVDEDQPVSRRRGGLKLVAAILMLAVVGTGGAATYKKVMGPRHSSDPPTIKADNTPTKIVPTPTDGAANVPDPSGDRAERIVPREEAPIDVDTTSANPRVVLPSSSQTAGLTPMPGNGGTSGSERRVRTVVIQNSAADGATSLGAPPQAAAPQATAQVATVQAAAPQAAAPVTRSVAPRNPATSANASANQPLSLAPQTAPARQQVASAIPTQIVPTAAPAESGVLVSISSQDSEAAAKASFRITQGKYPTVLGSRSPVIRRVELHDGKVIKYRAMVGPYRTRQEAVQFCTELKAAGGQCFIP